MARVIKTGMYRLRERLAQEFIQMMDSGELVMVEGQPLLIDGKPVMKRPSPAMLNVIRQFLRDNGIDRDPTDVDPDKPPLVESLPFVEEAEVLLPPPSPETD